jgi:hypothetical protein
LSFSLYPPLLQTSSQKLSLASFFPSSWFNGSVFARLYLQALLPSTRRINFRLQYFLTFFVFQRNRISRKLQTMSISVGLPELCFTIESHTIPLLLIVITIFFQGNK